MCTFYERKQLIEKWITEKKLYYGEELGGVKHTTLN